jgi:hypothetical protein
VGVRWKQLPDDPTSPSVLELLQYRWNKGAYDAKLFFCRRVVCL